MANYWYAYTGVGDPTVSTSYRLMSVIPGCLNGPAICAIFTSGGDKIPLSPLPERIQQYIANSLATLVAQPQDSGTAKKFVYMKPLA